MPPLLCPSYACEGNTSIFTCVKGVPVGAEPGQYRNGD